MSREELSSLEHKAGSHSELESWAEIAPKIELLSKEDILLCLAKGWDADRVRHSLARKVCEHEAISEFYRAMQGEICPTLEQVKEWLVENPNLAREKDPHGSVKYVPRQAQEEEEKEEEEEEEDRACYTVPLHAILRAFASSVSLEVIQVLVRAWPDALALGDENDDSPLEIACCNQAPLTIIQYLAEENPDAIGYVNEIRRIGGHTGGRIGGTPMENILRTESGLEVLEYLCKHWTDKVFPQDSSNLIKKVLDWDHYQIGPDDDYYPMGFQLFRAQFITPSVEYLKILVKYHPQILDYSKSTVVSMLQYALKIYPTEESKAPKWLHIIEWLVEIEPDAVQKCNKYSQYPLHTFLWTIGTLCKGVIPQERLSILQLLLEQGPEVITKKSTPQGHLPLDLATSFPRQTILPLLIDCREEQALFFYFQHGGNREATVKWILDGNDHAILNERDSENNVPLHIALRNKDVDAGVLVEMIRSAEVPDPTLMARNNQGELPLHLAAKNCNDYCMIKLFTLAYPEAVHERDGQGWFPFQLAAQNENTHSTNDHFEGFVADKALEMVYHLLRLAPDTLQT